MVRIARLEITMKLNRRFSYAILATVLAAGGAVAYADHRSEDGEPAADAVPVAQAPVSMVQAIQVAELRASGKARRAEYENSKLGWVYEVEVVSGNRVFDVSVSSINGTVLSAQEDAADRDEYDGRRDVER